MLIQNPQKVDLSHLRALLIQKDSRYGLSLEEKDVDNFLMDAPSIKLYSSNDINLKHAMEGINIDKRDLEGANSALLAITIFGNCPMSMDDLSVVIDKIKQFPATCDIKWGIGEVCNKQPSIGVTIAIALN
ncbi:MAG: hypothetical protein K2J82_00300 [Muribaculaceae bacterium]|nr:hypothetical protein [Muribaculaceae bacterium]